MRIIQIIDVRWYNAGADFAVIQAKALAGIGHDVLLMANPGSPPALKAREAGLDVFEKIDFAGLNILNSVAKLVRETRRFRPDVIFAHRGESHLVAALASRKTGCPVARFRGDVRPPRRGLFSRILNERLTGGIAVSTARLKDEYEKNYRLNGIPMQIIYPGIDASRFLTGRSKEELKAAFGLDPDALTVGIAGRLSPVKGHEIFIKAAGIVTERFPDAQFVIAGGDAQLSAMGLAEEAVKLGLGNIRFTGLINNIEELISLFDIGVVASIGSEMICRVLMEYFAARVAVVATDINQVSELMSLSGGGMVVPPGDSKSMAEAIIELCRDKRKRDDAAASGKSWVDNKRSLKHLALETEQFLGRVIDD